jgi:hypothetical protein
VGIQNLVLDSKQALPDSAFQFTPPDGAAEKDDLFDKGKPVLDLLQPSAGKE